MYFSLSMSLITGCMLGIEHAYVDDIHHIVVDILFVRILFEFAGE